MTEANPPNTTRFGFKKTISPSLGLVKIRSFWAIIIKDEDGDAWFAPRVLVVLEYGTWYGKGLVCSVTINFGRWQFLVDTALFPPMMV